MSVTQVMSKYEEYERLWYERCAQINAHRFAGGGFPARFTEKDKQEFIRTLATIDQHNQSEAKQITCT